MSYQVLARKWRPQNFDEVFGQSHVTTPLRNAINSDRVPHAILLTGPRGTGKTTLARILARCLNCEKGPTDKPCNKCTSCTEIAAGTSTDVREVDAASRTSVDDVRELIEAIRYAPSPGKHRIFVVDEVHMLSTAAFNALLKTLEEPPPRSLFVLATTNPEKIPFTVLSRCQRHDLRRIATAQIMESLRAIIKAEKIGLSEQSLLSVAREADGSLRDAQTLLDQVFSLGGPEISDEQVASVLDLVDRKLLLAIVEACVDGDPAAAIAACAQAGQSGADAKRLGENLLGLLRDLVVLRIAPDAKQLVEGGDAELEELRALAGRSDETRLRRMFRALLKEQEDLAWAPQPFAVLEMAVVRMATMASGADVAQLLARLDALERGMRGEPGGRGGPGSGSGRENSPRSRTRDEKTGISAQPPTPVANSAPKSPPAPVRSTPSPKAAAPKSPPAQVDSTPSPEAPAAAAPSEGSANAHPAILLDRLRSFLSADHPGLMAALEDGKVLEHNDQLLRVMIPEPFAATRLKGRIELLEAQCEKFFNRKLRVEIVSPNDNKAASPSDPEATPTGEALRELKQRALDHPAVNRAVEILEGEIIEIRPIGPPS